MKIIVFQSGKRLVDVLGEKILRVWNARVHVSSVYQRGFHYGQHKFKQVEVSRGKKILPSVAKIILATVGVPSNIL